MLLSQLIDPRVFVRLSEQEIHRLMTLLEAESVANPEIQKHLKIRIDKALPDLLKKK